MPLPDFNPQGESESSERERRPNPIVGGYAADLGYRQLSGSIAGGGTYAPVFDPYRERDVRRILGRVVNTGTIHDLQLALVQAGLLDEGEIALGYLDSDTQDAFTHILSIANQHGMNWRDVLSQAASSGGLGGNEGYGVGSGGSSPGPTVIQLPNRDDVVAGARDLGFELTGEMLDDDLHQAAADAVLDALRTQQERQVQREVAAMGQEGVVLFTESAPDPGRMLEEEIRRRAPGEVMGKGVRDLSDLWFESMPGPV